MELGKLFQVFLIKDPKGLELRMPTTDFTTHDLIRIFGSFFIVLAWILISPITEGVHWSLVRTADIWD